MSFSFSAAGAPTAVIATVGKEAANTPQMPQAFADAINNELSRLPSTAVVSLTCNGHTGWGQAQTKGTISLNVSIDVTAEEHPAAAAA